MKVTIDRTSFSSDTIPPCVEAKREDIKIAINTYDLSIDNKPIPGHYYKYFWFAEFDSFLEIIKKYGPIIVDKSDLGIKDVLFSVEIFDDYLS